MCGGFGVAAARSSSAIYIRTAISVTTFYSDCPFGYSSSFGQQRRHAVALRRHRGCVAAGCAAGSCCSSHINGSNTAQGHPDSLGPLCVGAKGMDVARGARQTWQHFLPLRWFLPPVTGYVCVAASSLPN